MEVAHPSNCYFSRELSWVEFNRRVLEQAQNPRWPALERAKFLAIFATNLDEFYMIRMSGVHEQISAGVNELGRDGLMPIDVLERVNATVRPLQAEHSKTWRSEVLPLLAEHGVHVLDWVDLQAAQQAAATAFFRNEVFPTLTPLAVDPAHPFPHISNLSLNLAVLVSEDGGAERFARVKVPTSFPRLVALDHDAGHASHPHHFVWLEQIIAANIGDLFPGMTVKGTYAPFDCNGLVWPKRM